MKNTLLLFSALFLALAGWNCKPNESGSAAAGSGTPSSGSETGQTGEATTKTEPKMRVRVDDLRVRKGPGKDAEVVGELKEGQIVEYTGEASRELEEVTLRGEKVKAPWMKVKLPSGGEGWVFGGALEDMDESAGSQAKGGGAAEFQTYLAGQPKASCDALKKAASKLKNDYGAASAADQDAAIRAFYDYYQDYISSQQDYVFGQGDDMDFDLLGYNPDNKPLPKAVKAKSEEWKSCGVGLEFPEGMANPMEDPAYMVNNFGNMGTPAMQEYLKRMSIDLKQGFSADAGLRITPAEFADRIVFWQQFQTKHPGFEMLPVGLPTFQEYIAFFMTGLDNTPAFDWGETNGLYPEWKAAYESVMSRVPNTVAGNAIKEYYQLLKDNGWKRTQKVIDYSTKYWGQHVEG